MEVVEVIYENGVFKFKKKFNLFDGIEVSVKFIFKKIFEKIFGIVKFEKEEVDKLI